MTSYLLASEMYKVHFSVFEKFFVVFFVFSCFVFLRTVRVTLHRHVVVKTTFQSSRNSLSSLYAGQHTIAELTHKKSFEKSCLVQLFEEILVQLKLVFKFYIFLFFGIWFEFLKIIILYRIHLLDINVFFLFTRMLKAGV